MILNLHHHEIVETGETRESKCLEEMDRLLKMETQVQIMLELFFHNMNNL